MSEQAECGLCGEEIRTDRFGIYTEDAGEFWDEAKQEGVLAHAQCGLDGGLDLA